MDDGSKHDTMTLRLPSSEPSTTSSVLVVDDEPMICRALERQLRPRGYDVATAATGVEALEAIRSRDFDVILSDINMPGMSGVDLLRIVRAYDLDVPVLLMTGNPTIESAVDAVSLGALEYLRKPMDTAAVLEAVARASRLHRLAKCRREAVALTAHHEMRVDDRRELEAALARALETMWMAFQPIVDVKHRRIFGYEALMRSREPSLPHPGAVLGAAERLDKLSDVGARVRDLSATAFARAPSGALLFVNLHSRDLLDARLYDADSPLSRIAERVVLEITERAALDDVKDIQKRVSELRSTGFKLAIDDLGAGYAGLSSFVALEPEIVKLDMSLVRNAHNSPVRERLIGSMTALCRELNIQVVAEGVELAEEGFAVRTAGCDLLQGYYFAKPGPPFPEVTF